jgi:DNA repair protein RecO (recombination protein O)
MNRAYKTTGINLKSAVFGEADRLLTILTPEDGLIRAVAPGARKSKSKLGGRANLFIVNELLLSKGRSLDKILQAETVLSFGGLSKQLARLTASQYLAELVLSQSVDSHHHLEVFNLLCHALSHLEQAQASEVLIILTQTVYQLLVWGGIAPQVRYCCLSRTPLVPDLSDPDWRIGLNLAAGGAVLASAVTTASREHQTGLWVGEQKSLYRSGPTLQLTAIELSLLQELARQPPPGLGNNETILKSYPHSVWLAVERALRQYAQYHLERQIRSTELLDICFSPIAAISSDRALT